MSQSVEKDAPRPTLDKVQEITARAVHAHPDLNRRERADALFAIVGEPDASFELVARFMMWADAYQERAVEIATETAYRTCVLPPEVTP
jgi:hypothetical protein